MQNKLLINLPVFQKNRSTQHALLKMFKTTKTKSNIGHKVGIIFMDLSKTFGGLNDELLITKLKFYGLDWNAVEF